MQYLQLHKPNLEAEWRKISISNLSLKSSIYRFKYSTSFGSNFRIPHLDIYVSLTFKMHW